MENESSGSFTSVTGARSRDLNFDSGSRGDHASEVQNTRSPVNTRDNHDYDDLNISSIRVQDPPVSTISRNKGIQNKYDGNIR